MRKVERRVVEVLRSSPIPVSVDFVRYNARTTWSNAKATLLELLLRGEVRGMKTSKSWVFWIEKEKAILGNEGFVCMETKKTSFHVCSGMNIRYKLNRADIENKPITTISEKYIASKSEFNIKEGDEICVEKYASNVSSLYYSKNKLVEI